MQFGAIASSAVLGVVFTPEPTAGSIQLVAWIVMGLGVAASVLTILDLRLRDLFDGEGVTGSR